MKRACVLALMAMVSSGAASAEWLYSVDVPTKRLCRVDTATGVVEVIGTLNDFNGSINDLEFLGERLFALANVSPNKRLIELDVFTGQIISSEVITDGGTPIVNASEGLGSDDKGNLLISFWFPGTPTTLSGQLGILGLDGAITLATPLGRDMDGLTRRFAGGMFSVDREPGAGVDQNTIFTVTHAPPTSGDLNVIPFGAVMNGVDDLAQTRTGLYTLDFATKNVIRLNPTTGTVLGSAPYNSAFTFSQVAAPPPCRGDADGDGDRDFADITAVLTAFNMPATPFALGDADGDGDVDFADITAVLETFAVACFP